MEGTGVYIYTRVSTAIQTEGYSLEAQRQKLLDFAKYRTLHVCREYSDEGHSGKNIAGREQFQQMLADIASKKDDISYVLVFKLSRFGRNAADVLNSLQFMQDYGVNLICVEDNIDSSADSGKLMISVMSAMAEIERENILVQTMAGRRQKAASGGWNGGITPYGYRKENGAFIVVEDEAKVIRDTFEIYVSTNRGAPYVAKELNKRYTKKVNSPNGVDKFTTDFVKRIVDNPFYCGKIAYGRTVSEKVDGRRNEFHRVSQQDDSKIIISVGKHEALISEEMWQLAQQKRQENAVHPERINKDHHYILAGLVKCACCGTRIYGRPNGQKKKKDGTLYAPSYSYACRANSAERGTECLHPTIFAEKPMAKALRDIIAALVEDDGFNDLVERAMNDTFDTDKLTADIAAAEKGLHRLQRLQQHIENQLNTIDYDSENAAKLEESYNNRLLRAIEDIMEAEARIAYLQEQMEHAQTLEDTKEAVYAFLAHFDEIYDLMDDADKRDFLKSFIDYIEVFPKEERRNGKWIKAIHFHFPMAQEDGQLYQSIVFDDGGAISNPNGQQSLHQYRYTEALHTGPGHWRRCPEYSESPGSGRPEGPQCNPYPDSCR